MVTYLKLGRYGRFGNQLFEIAGTIGLATKCGYEFGFPEWKNYDHKERFNSDEDINTQDYFVNKLPELKPGDYPEFSVKWGYHDIKIPDNVSLWGHFQSEKYFSHCKDLIMYYLQVKQLTDYDIPDNAVCIHVRLGDYDGAYHTRLGIEYYGQAMRYFTGPFYLFSDEPEKAYKIFGKEMTIVKNHYMTDYYLMCQFKNFIIGNSTFSLMPAILYGKKIVAPKNWFGPLCKATANDIYSENFIVI